MRDCGIVILAQNTDTVDYIACARTLTHSIRRVMPKMPVTLISNDPVSDGIWDCVVPLPLGDNATNNQWKLELDSQVYAASPYKYTLKLESDLYIPRSLNNWFEILKNRDLNICTTIRDYTGKISRDRFYRKTVDVNKLPDTYNAITYFRKSNLVAEFYELVADIFSKWELYTADMLVNKREYATTDVVYAIAADIIGREWCTLPTFTQFSMVHMKPLINPYLTSQWYNYFPWECGSDFFRIASYAQLYPVHYHHKEWAHICREQIDA